MAVVYKMYLSFERAFPRHTAASGSNNPQGTVILCYIMCIVQPDPTRHNNPTTRLPDPTGFVANLCMIFFRRGSERQEKCD